MARSRFAHTLLSTFAIVALVAVSGLVGERALAPAGVSAQGASPLDVADGHAQLDEALLNGFLALAGYEPATLPGGWRELRTPGSTTGDVQVTLSERPGSLTIVTNVGVLGSEADVAVLERALQNAGFPGAGELFAREQRAVVIQRVALKGLTRGRFEEEVATGRTRAAALRQLVDARIAGDQPDRQN